MKAWPIWCDVCGVTEVELADKSSDLLRCRGCGQVFADTLKWPAREGQS